MKNNEELKQLKIKYDKNLEEITSFLETGKTYRDMELEGFRREIKLFWERAEVWYQAGYNAIYPADKLNEDFKKFDAIVTRLMIGED